MAVKLGTTNEKRFGSTITLFAAGTVEISEEGIFEVENEDIAKEVVDTYHPEFDYVDAPGLTTTETTTLKVEVPVITETTTLAPVVSEITTETTTMEPEELKKKSETDELNQSEKNDIGNTEGSSEKEILMKSIDEMDITALQEQAKPFPKKEWSKLGVEELKAFLKAKLA